MRLVRGSNTDTLPASVGNPPGIRPALIPWCFFARRQPVAESLTNPG